jgi:hypothetical protein
LPQSPREGDVSLKATPRAIIGWERNYLLIGITDTEKYEPATSNDTDRIVHVIHATLTAEGINVASPEGQEITASLLRRVRTGAGVTPTRVWIRSRLAQDLIDTVEWIGLVIDA